VRVLLNGRPISCVFRSMVGAWRCWEEALS